MTNAPHDLRDYVLDELTPGQRTEVEQFLATSVEGREEVERLRAMHVALQSLPQEEPPRRIAFVSDKVFEPSPARRLWQGFLAGAPRLAFGLAAVLLVFFAGAWATQPTLTQDPSGWRLAFGQPGPAAPALQPDALEAPAGLSAEGIQQVREILRESETRQQEALVEVLRSETSRSHAEMRAAITKAREEWDEAYLTFIKGGVDRLYRDAAEFNMAALGR
jgi:anti-sigma factor RsiW